MIVYRQTDRATTRGTFGPKNKTGKNDTDDISLVPESKSSC